MACMTGHSVGLLTVTSKHLLPFFVAGMGLAKSFKKLWDNLSVRCALAVFIVISKLARGQDWSYFTQACTFCCIVGYWKYSVKNIWLSLAASDRLQHALHVAYFRVHPLLRRAGLSRSPQQWSLVSSKRLCRQTCFNWNTCFVKWC